MTNFIIDCVAIHLFLGLIFLQFAAYIAYIDKGQLELNKILIALVTWPAILVSAIYVATKNRKV